MNKYYVYAKMIGENNWYYLKPSLDFCDALSDSCIWFEDWGYIYNYVSEDAKKYDYEFKIVRVEE